MKAIILAAGTGSRLLPLTENTPKCLLKIDGTSILDFLIKSIRNCGINEIVVVTGHCGDKIKDVFGDDLIYVDNKEYASTNSAYSLWLAREHLKEGFVSFNSDTLFDLKLLKLLLDSSYDDAMIIERHVLADCERQRLLLEGDKILKMEKYMSPEKAHADAIGPVKFSKNGAEKVIKRLNETIIDEKNLNQWAFSVFGEVAENSDVFGLDSENLLYLEFNTASDFENVTKENLDIIKNS